MNITNENDLKENIEKTPINEKLRSEAGLLVKTKKTPEELYEMRMKNITKAQETKKSNAIQKKELIEKILRLEEEKSKELITEKVKRKARQNAVNNELQNKVQELEDQLNSLRGNKKEAVKPRGRSVKTREEEEEEYDKTPSPPKRNVREQRSEVLVKPKRIDNHRSLRDLGF